MRSRCGWRLLGHRLILGLVPIIASARTNLTAVVATRIPFLEPSRAKPKRRGVGASGGMLCRAVTGRDTASAGVQRATVRPHSRCGDLQDVRKQSAHLNGSREFASLIEVGRGPAWKRGPRQNLWVVWRHKPCRWSVGADVGVADSGHRAGTTNCASAMRIAIKPCALDTVHFVA